MLEILKNPNFDFLGKARYFIGASLLVILAGLAYMFSQHIYLGSNAKGYGVEFSGGTQLIVKFTSPPQVDRVRTAVNAVDNGAVIQAFGKPADNTVLIRLAGTDTAVGTTTEEAGGELTKGAQAVRQALATGYSENAVLEASAEVVGPVVGAELRRKAVMLTLFGLVFQLIYIGIRFKGAIWGAAATIAVFHDVLVTLAFLAFFRYEITLNVIAALLTLVGYSVNDTIVIFDRARENLRHKRKESLRQILNESLNQTLTRTLISNGTTFLAVLGLFLFGGEVLRGFGFTMVVGIIVGTYSTIYIASPIVIWWQQRHPSATGSRTASTAKAAL
jgi:preprotein translocase subunit SecF